MKVKLTTRLGDQPVPAVAEIAANQEFVVKEISRAEFEAVWDAAFDSNIEDGLL